MKKFMINGYIHELENLDTIDTETEIRSGLYYRDNSDGTCQIIDVSRCSSYGASEVARQYECIAEYLGQYNYTDNSALYAFVWIKSDTPIID